MRKGWQTVKLGEVAEIVGGGTPSTTKEEYWNGDIPWISIKDFAGDIKYIYTTEKSITQLGLQNSSTKMLQEGDIIISARGTVGELAQIIKPMAFNQSCYGIRTKSKIYYNYFLFYTIKISIKELKNNAHGSVFDTITTNTLTNLDIPLPPLEEQERIASILSAFDDKIEVNNKICNDLEALAKLLFNNKFTANPNKDSWPVAKLGDFFPIITGKKNVNVTSENGVYPFFSCSHKVSWTNEFSFDASAILLAGNGDFNIKWYQGKFEAYQRTYVLIPYDLEKFFFLYLLMEKSLLDIVQGFRGSVINFITKGMIENYKFPLPPAELLAEFEAVVAPLFAQIKNLQQQNASLASTRDLLLPRLMKGEV